MKVLVAATEARDCWLFGAVTRLVIIGTAPAPLTALLAVPELLGILDVVRHGRVLEALLDTVVGSYPNRHLIS